MNKTTGSIIIIIWSILTYQQPSIALPKSDPFQNFSIFIGPIVNSNRNSFHDYWRPGTGIETRIQLPFYYGRVQGGVIYLPFSAESKDQIEFISDYIYLGWGSGLFETQKIQIEAGIKAGSFRFRFGEDEEERYRQTEAEFCAGVYTGSGLNIHDHWKVDFTASYLRIFTARRIELIFLSVGITRIFATPQWLLDFLR